MTAGDLTAECGCQPKDDPRSAGRTPMPDDWYAGDLEYYVDSREAWERRDGRSLAMTVSGSVTHLPDCHVITGNVRLTDDIIAYLEGCGDKPKGNIPYPRWVDGTVPTCRHCLGWTGRL